jgi:hypothetical protein
MRFVTFQSAACDAPVSVQASLVHAVGAKTGKEHGEWEPNQSVLVMTADAIVVHGSVAEVVAALEAAGAPESTRTAGMLCDALARTISHGVRLPDWHEIDRVLGLSPDDSEWTDTAAALQALAARLRGVR